jgi:hypothetical protein
MAPLVVTAWDVSKTARIGDGFMFPTKKPTP